MLARLVSVTLVTLTIGLMLLITVQIVMRYLIGKSLPWSLEVSQILFIWIVFLGSALAVEKRQFAAMEILATRLPRWWSQRLVFVVIVVFAIVFGTLAVNYVGQTSLQRLTMTRLPSTVIYIAPVVASFLMVVFALQVALADASKTDDTLKDLQA